MGVKLELVYLLKVVMKFLTKEDLLTFMSVNHKCHETLKALKVNPKVINSPTIRWFFKHFSPDTFDSAFLDFEVERFIENVKFFRNVNLYYCYKDGRFNEKFCAQLFPKITRLTFYSFEDPVVMEMNKELIKNSKLFSSLYYLDGDLQLIAQFLENYTENGKEKYLHLPTFIVANTLNSLQIPNTYQTQKLIETIEANVPKNDCVNICICMYEQPKDEHLLDIFKTSNYYYLCARSGMCQKWNDKIVCNSGVVYIDGNVEGDIMNGMINKTYANVVYHRFDNAQATVTWNIPDCVKKLCWNRSNNSDHANVLKPTIVPNIACLWLKVLSIAQSECLCFQNDFQCLEKVEVTLSANISFGKECKLGKVTFIGITSSNDFKVNTSLPLLSKLKITTSTNINLAATQLLKLKELYFINCNSIVLPSISFENKIVQIVDTKNVKFDNGNNPIAFLDLSLDYFNTTINKSLQIPFTVLEANEWKMVKFMPMSNRVEVRDNELFRLESLKDEEYDMLISMNFYNESEKDKYMKCKKPTTFTKTGLPSCPEDDDYFQLGEHRVDDVDTFSSSKRASWVERRSIGYHAD
ncbi:hypothetical protein EIN_278300, partial [Entamoeba invadens IP1]